MRVPSYKEFVETQKPVFIKQYVATFLATYAAVGYDDRSLRGTWKTFKHPTEDAEFLAEKAWKELHPEVYGEEEKET